MKVIDKGQVFSTAATSTAVTIPAGEGLVVGRHTWYTSPAAGTITVYRPRSMAVANAAVAADTALVVKTDAAGKIDGAVATTNDYILALDPSTGAAVLSKISTVAAVSSSTVALTMATALTCTASQVLYLIRAADIVVVTTAAATVNDMDNWFVGKGFRMPVHIVMAATGTNLIAVCYQIEQ